MICKTYPQMNVLHQQSQYLFIFKGHSKFFNEGGGVTIVLEAI